MRAPTLLFAALCLASTLRAEEAAPALSLAPVFGDHAVLQRDKPVPVWGQATAGSTITVAFHGQAVSTVAGADGRWRLSLEPLAASSEGADLSVRGPGSLVLHDVVVGEVWLCSGQSNMEFVVDDGGATYRVAHASEEVAAAHFPLIRQLKVDHAVATSPQERARTSGWVAATPDTVGQFTAVGYFFARDIHLATGVPVGIIDSPWGGTPVESWIRDDARRATKASAAIDARWKQAMGRWTLDRLAQYPVAMEGFSEAEFEAMADGTKNPVAWPEQPATVSSPYLPGGLFNAMIAPLQPCALRGFLWYQGESNVGHADEYGELFAALIRSWRTEWGQGDLPFYFVQIANFGDEAERAHRDWALLREAQQSVLNLPATGMAVTIDIGEAGNIHPRNKQEVGRRLALLARAGVYGMPAETSGPVFVGAEASGGRMVARFSHASPSLVAKGGEVTSLEVAGADRVFHEAKGVIEGDTLAASSPEVPEPVAVRYAWLNAPRANLYNAAGLPAAPFRSDAW